MLIREPRPGFRPIVTRPWLGGDEPRNGPRGDPLFRYKQLIPKG